MSFSHGSFCGFVQAPLSNFRSGAQSSVEVPVRKVGEIDGCHGLIAEREAIHSVDAECPQQLEPAIGKVSERVSYLRVTGLLCHN